MIARFTDDEYDALVPVTSWSSLYITKNFSNQDGVDDWIDASYYNIT